MKTAEHHRPPTWTVAPGGLGRALHYGASPRLYAGRVGGARKHPVRWEPDALPDRST
jgi:hypothetical protein